MPTLPSGRSDDPDAKPGAKAIAAFLREGGEAMRLMIAAALIAPALAACSAEPRWTLWEIKAGEAIKRESGLERLVCETLRTAPNVTSVPPVR